MSEFKWTDEQNSAIRYPKSTLVSASAGSGKTTIIVERILNKLDECDINKILVLTFNEAIAAEMKLKIADKLFKLIKESEPGKREKYREQLDKLPLADICTFHGFCARLIKSNFEAAGIDPNFTVMDKTEADGYFSEALKTTLEGYLFADDEEYLSLQEMFGRAGRDEDIIKTVTELYNYANIEPEPDKFLDGMIERQNKDIFVNIAEETVLNHYKNIFGVSLENIMLALNAFDNKEFPKYSEYYLDIADYCRNMLSSKNCGDMLLKIQNSEIRTTKGERNAPPEIGETLKILKENLKKRIKETAESINCGIISPEEQQSADILIFKLIEIVKKLAATYISLKKKDNKLDFNDLEHIAVRLFSDDAKVDEIKKDYDFIFVDEYQDTNPTQEYILNKISGEDNLFAVGDIKQSIYGFRLAMPDILLDRYNKYKINDDKKAIDLNTNFRSEKGILDFINQVFKPIMTEKSCLVDYEKTSMLNTTLHFGAGRVEGRLFYKGKEKKEKEPQNEVYSVKYHNFEVENEIKTAVNEADYIAEKINEIVGKDLIEADNGIRPVNYGDIAILFRTRNKGDGIIERLTERGIPVNSSGFAKEKYVTEKNTLINLMRVVNNEKQDIPLVGYMLSYFGGFTRSELAQIKLGNNEEFFFNAVRAASEKDTPLGLKTKKMLDGLSKLRQLSAFKDVFSLLNDLISQSGYDAYVLKEPDGKDRFNTMQMFLHGINGKKYSLSPGKLLAYIDNAGNVEAEPMPVEEGNSVFVNTIHGSKGLEYPVVFVAGLDGQFKKGNYIKDVNIDEKIGVGVMIYDEKTRVKRNSIVNEAIKLKCVEKALQEEMRIFYVALTRAKNMLFLSGGTSENFGETPKPLFEMNSASDLLWDAYYKNPELHKYLNLQPLKEISKLTEIRNAVVFNKPTELYRNIINNIVNYKYPHKIATEVEQKYSVSDLNSENINADSLVINKFKEDKKLLGIAYHKIMENIDLSLITLDEVKKAISEMACNDIITSAEEKQIDAAVILKCLMNPVIKKAASNIYYRELPFMLNLPANEIGGININLSDNVLVQGTVDLLILGGENIIIDYKTSAKQKDELIRDYGRQLQLYALAVESSMGIKIHKKGMYSFITGELYFI